MILIILYSLVIGFKYSMGADFEAYLSHYQRVYDGNEYDVTEQFKVLGINIDNAVKDNFIVLQKDKKGDI